MSGSAHRLSLGRRIIIGVAIFVALVLAVVLFLTYTLVPK
jgi:hypothetical protein